MTSAPSDGSYREQLANAKRFIESNDRFLVVSHLNPDGDAVSSTLAAGWILEKLGKPFVLINEGRCPAKFGCLPGFDRLLSYADDELPAGPFGCVISVDCADEARCGEVKQLFAVDVRLLNIDHHPTNTRFGSVQLIRADAAATVELLYDLALEMKLPIDRSFAELIYTGLLTDTGGFRFSNTTPRVMRIAADLLGYGVNGSWLAEHLLAKMTRAHITLLKRALNSLSFAYGGKACWMTVSAEDMAECEASSEDLDGLIDYPRNIEGVEVGILFKQYGENSVKVSFRSNSYVDVAAIAQSFGGGGHVRASGCTIEGRLQDVVEHVVKEVGQSFS